MYPPKKEEKKRIILHISTELELFAAFCALHSLRYEKKKKSLSSLELSFACT